MYEKTGYFCCNRHFCLLQRTIALKSISTGHLCPVEFEPPVYDKHPGCISMYVPYVFHTCSIPIQYVFHTDLIPVSLAFAS